MVLVPMPSIRAPSATRKCARSCTCGSEAALRRSWCRRRPPRRISAFSVAVTLGSSRKTSAPVRRAGAEFKRCVDGDRWRRAARAPEDACRRAAVRSRRRPAAAARPRRSAPASARRAGSRRGSARTASGSRSAARTSLGVDRERVASPPFGGRADRADQLHQRFGIADPRHVLQRDGMLGQQRRGDDRQRGVLVAGRLDGAGQAVAALDDVLDGRCPRRVANFMIHGDPLTGSSGSKGNRK